MDDRAWFAGHMMVAYLNRMEMYRSPMGKTLTDLRNIEDCARLAVQAADILLKELKKETKDATK